MKRTCIYFVAVLSLMSMGLTAMAGPFSVPTVSEVRSVSGPFSIPDIPEPPKDITHSVNTYERVPVYTNMRFCQNGRCWYEKVKTGSTWKLVKKEVTFSTGSRSLPAEAQPTPMIEVHRILSLLGLKKGQTIVDFGCGDARFLIAAAKKYGVRGIGIEIDIKRAAEAQYLVDQANLTNKITILHGDATELTDIKADVGVAYLFPETLEKLKPQIKNLKKFASYQHKVEGLDMVKYGDSYVWKKPEQVAVAQPQQQYAVWQGYQYAGPVCNNRGCRMCNSIRRQLGY